jgi:hypothetical protein
VMRIVFILGPHADRGREDRKNRRMMHGSR